MLVVASTPSSEMVVFVVVKLDSTYMTVSESLSSLRGARISIMPNNSSWEYYLIRTIMVFMKSLVLACFARSTASCQYF